MIDYLQNGSKVNSVEELFGFVSSLKNPEMRTNAVFSPSILKKYCAEKDVNIIKGEKSAIVLIPDNDNITRIYYYVETREGFNEILSLIPRTGSRLVCDIVGRDPKAKDQAYELEAFGFDIYAKFQRMICNELKVDNSLDLNEVEVAKASDVQEILNITYEEFDPLTARIHSAAELVRIIEKKEVLIIRREDKIAGFAMFDSLNKKVALFDHMIVRPEYRNDKLGRKLLQYKWRFMNNSDYYFLWINAISKAAIRHHERNGFRADGTYDYILVLK